MRSWGTSWRTTTSEEISRQVLHEVDSGCAVSSTEGAGHQESAADP